MSLYGKTGTGRLNCSYRDAGKHFLNRCSARTDLIKFADFKIFQLAFSARVVKLVDLPALKLRQAGTKALQDKIFSRVILIL